MLVIGIPTLNEEKNIATLVKKIDLAAKKLNLNVVIVNADSMSSDATVKKFKSTTTLAKKVVFLNSRRGKGINIFSIFNYASQIQNLDGCILIDGDVTSGIGPVGIFFGNTSAELSYYAQMAIYVFMGLVIPATTQSSHFVPCNSEGRRIQ